MPLSQQPTLNIENGNELFEPMLPVEYKLSFVVQALVGCYCEATTHKYRGWLQPKREDAVLPPEVTRLRVKACWMSLVFRQKLAIAADKTVFYRAVEEVLRVWICKEEARLWCHNGEIKATLGVGLVVTNFLPVLPSQDPPRHQLHQIQDLLETWLACLCLSYKLASGNSSSNSSSTI